MLKSYTFKVMAKSKEACHVVSCVHCPLEIFYESFKKTPELTELYNNSKNSGFKFYVKVTDLPDENGVLDERIYKFCTLEPLVLTSSFKEFLCSANVLDLETLEPSDELIADFLEMEIEGYDV